MKIFLIILYILAKNSIFYHLISSKKHKIILLIFFYWLQFVLSIFLYNNFWKSSPKSLEEAIPILINLDFVLFLFYQLFRLNLRLIKKIDNGKIFKNLFNQFDFLEKELSSYFTILNNYIAITILELILVFVIL